MVVLDILPPGCADFREVCAKFGGRLRTALSNPNLSTLVEEMVQPPQLRGGHHGRAVRGAGVGSWGGGWVIAQRWVGQ